MIGGIRPSKAPIGLTFCTVSTAVFTQKCRPTFYGGKKTSATCSLSIYADTRFGPNLKRNKDMFPNVRERAKSVKRGRDFIWENKCAFHPK